MVLLVIDAQKLIMTRELYQFDTFITNVKKLMEEARKNQHEVIYVRHEDANDEKFKKGTEGFEIYDEFYPKEGEKIFDKTINSPFRDTGLLEYLQEIGEKELMVAGLQTDYCIDATVKCGFEHGFRMLVPEYANSTFDNEFMKAEKIYKYYNEFMWNGRYAECISMDRAIAVMNGE